MNRDLFGGATTVFVSTIIVLVLIMVGFISFGVAVELEKASHVSGISDLGNFNPNSLPATGAGIPEYDLDRSQGEERSQHHGYSQGSGRPLDCDGVIFRVAENGTRLVRESGGGRYYAAEVNNTLRVYTLDYGYLVEVEHSSLDAHAYRKLKHALYHCDGEFTRSGLHIALNPAENKPG